MNHQQEDASSQAFQEAGKRCADKIGREYRLIAFLSVLLATVTTWLPVWFENAPSHWPWYTTVMLVLALLLLLKEIVIFARLRNGLYGTDKQEAEEIIRFLQNEQPSN
jgi:hypothetical protein